MFEKDHVLLPIEAVKSMRRIIDAAEEAICGIYIRATRTQFSPGVPPEVEAFYQAHGKIVCGSTADELDEIF